MTKVAGGVPHWILLIDTTLLHLVRLSGVARILMTAMEQNARMPLGALKIIDFQDISESSSSREDSISS